MINNIILVGKLISKPLLVNDNKDKKQKWYQLQMHIKKPFQDQLIEEHEDIVAIKIWDKQLHHLKNILIENVIVGIKGHITNKNNLTCNLEIIAENIVLLSN